MRSFHLTLSLDTSYYKLFIREKSLVSWLVTYFVLKEIMHFFGSPIYNKYKMKGKESSQK